MRAPILLLLIVFVACGATCRDSGKYKLKGGTSKTTTSEGGFTNITTFAQPENPERQSSQDASVERKETTVLPAGTIIRETKMEGTNPVMVETRIPMATTKSVEFRQRTDTHLGGAQRNTAMEFAAKVSSMKPVQFAGIGLILVAVGLAYFKWFTPAIVAGGAGVGLIILSSVLVSHTLLIAIILAVALVIYITFYAYNKGSLDGVLPDNLDKKKPHPSTVVTVTQPTPKPPDITVVSNPSPPIPPSV